MARRRTPWYAAQFPFVKLDREGAPQGAAVRPSHKASRRLARPGRKKTVFGLFQVVLDPDKPGLLADDIQTVDLIQRGPHIPFSGLVGLDHDRYGSVVIGLAGG